MTGPTTPAAVDPQQERGGDDAAAILAFLDARDSAILGDVKAFDEIEPHHGDRPRLSATRLRAVLTELERLRAEVAPQFVWMHGNDERSSAYAYITAEDALPDAIDYYDPALADEPERWSLTPLLPTRADVLELCCDGDPVDYRIYRVRVEPRRGAAEQPEPAGETS